ncbi:beta strand repeat-containing protein [Flavobacterium zepuense]|nr:Ig-like domain-containing protein [Flavobacterium zepuense]
MNQITFTTGPLQRLRRAFKATLTAAIMLVTFYGNAQTWGYLGAEAGISGGGASFINFAKGPTGTLYMSYYDTSVSKGSVQQYASGGWSYVGGSAGITTGTATYNSLSVDASGTIYYTNQLGWPGSGMEVRSFNGTAWSSLPSVTTAGINYQASVVSSNGILVAANGEASGTAKRYVNGAWEQLGAAGFAGGTPTYLKMVAGNNGVVYASYNNNGNVHVSKIADSATSTDAWEAVGTANVGAASSSENYNSSIAIHQNNNLYLAYVSGSAGGNKLNVKKYDGTTWTQLGTENFSTGKVQHVSIAVTASGTPYVVASNWEDADFLKNYVMAYNAGTNTWTQLGTGFISAGQATYNALATDSDGNLVLAYADNSLGKILARTYTVTDTPPATPVTGVTVTTQNNVPATITTAAGTLQLVATVAPVAASQAVTWSITTGAAFATVDANGLVTATANGTVTVRATSVADATKFGEMAITVNILPACPSLTSLYENFDTLSCCAMGVVPTCWNSLLLGGASQIISSTQPASGTSQIYQNGYGAGKISIVALPHFSNVNAGTHQFRFKAKANSGPGILEFGYITDVNDATTFVIIQTITISNSSYTSTDAERTFTVPTTVPADARLAIRNPGTTWAGMYWDDVYWEPIPVTVQIATQNNAPATITTNAGTLQLVATVTPVAEAVTWTISTGTGLATINANGLVTAIVNGTITVTATTAGGATDMFDVVITNQAVLAAAIEISTLNNVAATITTNAGTLQLVATVTPANTTDTTVTWSITAGTGLATIDANGLVTAIANGTITVTATSANGLTDTFEVVITNQTVEVTAITISTEDDVPATITTAAGTLQLIATITPSNATDTTVTWSITEGSEFATIDADGLVTAVANGTITVTATSANGVTDTFEVVINIPTTGLGDVSITMFSVYPNPTNGVLNISASQEITGYTVYCNLGQQVTAGKGSQINLQGVQNGMYLVQVTFNGGANKTVKVIKQ